MSDRKKKIRKAADKVQRRLLGDDDDKKKVMENSPAPEEEGDASLPRGKESDATGLIPTNSGRGPGDGR